MWKILQQKKPDDYVIATGIQYSIKQFINLTTKKLNMKITWKGKGLREKAYDEKGFPIIECDKNYFRPFRCKYTWRCKKGKKTIKMETIL